MLSVAHCCCESKSCCQNPCEACVGGCITGFTLTDRNGVQVGGTSSLLWTPPVVRCIDFFTGDYFDQTPTPMSYFYRIECVGSQLKCTLITPWDVEFGNGIWSWVSGTCDGFPVTGQQIPITVTPTCTGSEMTATFTFPSIGGTEMPGPTVDFHADLSEDPVCCAPCDIPTKDLTVSWTNSIIGPGSHVLTFDGSPHSAIWSTGCFTSSPGNPLTRVALECITGSISFSFCEVDNFCDVDVQPECCTWFGSNVTGGDVLELVDYTCNPLHLHFYVHTTCAIYPRGYVDIYLDE